MGHHDIEFIRQRRAMYCLTELIKIAEKSPEIIQPLNTDNLGRVLDKLRRLV